VQVAERGIAMITRVNLVVRFRLSLIQLTKPTTALQQALCMGYLEYGEAAALIETIMDIWYRHQLLARVIQNKRVVVVVKASQVAVAVVAVVVEQRTATDAIQAQVEHTDI
tara:strand:- start:783 stop:1115 length:333 start_codon:yes stop_codon:yes gene_type:complete